MVESGEWEAYPVITFVRDNVRNLLIAESGLNTVVLVGGEEDIS